MSVTYQNSQEGRGSYRVDQPYGGTFAVHAQCDRCPWRYVECCIETFAEAEQLAKQALVDHEKEMHPVTQ